jgi:hypothetical protein
VPTTSRCALSRSSRMHRSARRRAVRPFSSTHARTRTRSRAHARVYENARLHMRLHMSLRCTCTGRHGERAERPPATRRLVVGIRPEESLHAAAGRARPDQRPSSLSRHAEHQPVARVAGCREVCRSSRRDAAARTGTDRFTLCLRNDRS